MTVQIIHKDNELLCYNSTW